MKVKGKSKVKNKKKKGGGPLSQKREMKPCVVHTFVFFVV